MRFSRYNLPKWGRLQFDAYMQYILNFYRSDMPFIGLSNWKNGAFLHISLPFFFFLFFFFLKKENHDYIYYIRNERNTATRVLVLMSF